MALKDWKKEPRDYFTPKHHELIWIKPGIAKVTLFSNKDIPSLNVYPLYHWGIHIEEFKGMRHVYRMDSRGDVTIGGNSVIKRFKTKSNALNFAKQYMRTH